jgi:hypothetical protein
VQATLEGDMLTGLLSIIGKSKGTECPGLAAAVLSVCLVQLPHERRNEGLIPVIVQAVLEFLGGVSAALRQGAAHFDAESFYMAGALLQLLRRGNEDVWLMAVTQADLLSKLLLLAPVLLAAEHDLGISMALGLIVPLAQGNFSSKTDMLQAGLITQVPFFTPFPFQRCLLFFLQVVGQVFREVGMGCCAAGGCWSGL